jgi:hypothetical protein
LRATPATGDALTEALALAPDVMLDNADAPAETFACSSGAPAEQAEAIASNGSSKGAAAVNGRRMAIFLSRLGSAYGNA